MSGTRCIRAVADLHAAPDTRSERVSQCLFGERVDVLERTHGWCRVRNRRDGYTGHVRADALGTARRPAGGDAVEDGGGHGDERARTHIVMVRATLLFTAPDLKSPVRLRVPFGAELRLADDAGATGAADDGAAPGGTRFARVHAVPGTGPEDGATGAAPGDAFVWRAHCARPGTRLPGTLVELARHLYDGAPYLWGGRTPDGADCSGLVQGAAFALGLRLPRDSDQQERFLEQIVPFAGRRASDVVFWPGHVGVLVAPDTLYHATAHHLSSAVEPLDDVIGRAGRPSSVRRLPTADEEPGERRDR